MDELKNIEQNKLNSIHIINKMVETMYTETKMSLSLTQKKLIFYLASLIQENDTELHPVTLSFADIMKILGLEYSGRNVETIKKAIDGVNGKSFWIEDGPMLINCTWIKSGTVIDRKNKTVTICLDDTLKPFFIGISECARTIFQYGYITNFKCKHSIDLYRYSSRFKNLNAPVKIPIEKALRIFGDGKYKRYNDLLERVLRPAVGEINQFTDLKISISPFLAGRKVTHLILTVIRKSGSELEQANQWKLSILSTASIHGYAADVYRDELVMDAISTKYLDADSLDSPEINEFDPELYKLYKRL